MARLYAWLRSDKGEAYRTKEGNETIEVQINYGSKDKTLYVGEMVVVWHKGSERPEVRFHIANDIPYEVNKVQ